MCLQGELEVVKEIPNKLITEKKENSDFQNSTEKLSDGGTERDAFVTETSKMPFLMLGLDLPPPPLFKDVMEKNIIPQVLMHFLLSFYCICSADGTSLSLSRIETDGASF